MTNLALDDASLRAVTGGANLGANLRDLGYSAVDGTMAPYNTLVGLGRAGFGNVGAYVMGRLGAPLLIPGLGVGAVKVLQNGISQMTGEPQHFIDQYALRGEPRPQ